MTRKLNAHTIVPGEHGEPVTLGPDDEVPEWAVQHIGDHLWAADEGEDAEKSTSSRRPRAARSKSGDDSAGE